MHTTVNGTASTLKKPQSHTKSKCIYSSDEAVRKFFFIANIALINRWSTFSSNSLSIKLDPREFYRRKATKMEIFDVHLGVLFPTTKTQNGTVWRQYLANNIEANVKVHFPIRQPLFDSRINGVAKTLKQLHPVLFNIIIITPWYPVQIDTISPPNWALLQTSFCEILIRSYCLNFRYIISMISLFNPN